MSKQIRIQDDIIKAARKKHPHNNHAMNKLIHHWIHLGQAIEENPDLPPSFVHNILLSQQEAAEGKTTPYTPSKTV